MTRRKTLEQLERHIEGIFFAITIATLVFVLVATIIVVRWFR
jgi:hypothetical protein